MIAELTPLITASLLVVVVPFVLWICFAHLAMWWDRRGTTRHQNKTKRQIDSRRCGAD